jgi:hypothetical protein
MVNNDSVVKNAVFFSPLSIKEYQGPTVLFGFGNGFFTNKPWK